MTEQERQAIRERVNKATQGPWYWDDDDRTMWRDEENGAYDGVFTTDEDYTFKDADTEFIAHAREDVPKLLDEVERLQTEIELADNTSAMLQESEQLHALEVLEFADEVKRLRMIAEAVDEITVDVGIHESTVSVNRAAYEALCQTLIDTGWWSKEMIEEEQRIAVEDGSP